MPLIANGLFMNNQGWETKEIENQPRLKKFNLKSNLTCNIYTEGVDFFNVITSI